MGVVSKGFKNEFETANVNEPSVFEPLKFYCSLRSTSPRPWFCLGSSNKAIKTKASHHKTKTNDSKTLNIYFLLIFYFFYYKARQRAKWVAMQVATMLADHKQTDKRTTLRNQNISAALGRSAMKLLVGGGGGASTSFVMFVKR